MQHRQIVVLRLARDGGEIDAMWRCVDELAAGHERGSLREPGGIPERADFAPRLVTRTGTTIEAVKGGCLEEERPHHGHASC